MLKRNSSIDTQVCQLVWSILTHGLGSRSSGWRRTGSRHWARAQCWDWKEKDKILVLQGVAYLQAPFYVVSTSFYSFRGKDNAEFTSMLGTVDNDTESKFWWILCSWSKQANKVRDRLPTPAPTLIKTTVVKGRNEESNVYTCIRALHISTSFHPVCCTNIFVNHFLYT